MASRNGATPATSATKNNSAALRSGTFVNRNDLHQAATGSRGDWDSSDAAPIVTVFELEKADPVTGGSLWFPLFEGDPDTDTGAERTGYYRGEAYSYFNRTPRLYSDTNKNEKLDSSDRAFGPVFIPKDVREKTQFTKAPSEGTWQATSGYAWTLIPKDTQISVGPISSPADFMAYASPSL